MSVNEAIYHLHYQSFHLSVVTRGSFLELKLLCLSTEYQHKKTQTGNSFKHTCSIYFTIIWKWLVAQTPPPHTHTHTPNVILVSGHLLTYWVHRVGGMDTKIKLSLCNCKVPTKTDIQHETAPICVCVESFHCPCTCGLWKYLNKYCVNGRKSNCRMQNS